MISTTVLSPQERRAVEGLAGGLTVSAIAENMGVRKGTVNGYLQMARGKLGARRAPALVHAAYLAGELPTPDPDRCPIELTGHQYELLRLIAEGLPAAEMAGKLHRSVKTVRRSVQALLDTMGATSPAHAVFRAHQLRLLQPASRETRQAATALPAPSRTGDGQQARIRHREEAPCSRR